MVTTPDLLQIQEQVAEVRVARKSFINDLMHEYAISCDIRDREGIPALGFCGHGRAGKDLASAWLSANYNLRYSGSISKIIAPLVAYSTNRTVDEAFTDRHNDRMYWFEYCNELRRQDPTFLVKLTLGLNDMVAGIRGDIELEACRAEGVIDCAIWVENDRVPIDPTLEYGADDCDIVIRNCGPKLTYFRRLRSLAGMLDLPVRETVRDCEDFAYGKTSE